MNAYELESFFNDFFDIKNIQDASINGLQVACSKDKEINKICYCVDACLRSILQAIEEEADALVCHHGLLWKGQDKKISNNHYDRIKLLLSHDIALYGIHLPLDIHPQVGNNIYIASKFRYKNISRASFDSKKIGFFLEFENEDFDNIMNILKKNFGINNIMYHKKNKSNIKNMFIISGGGHSYVDNVIDNNIDLFVTGEFLHKNFHAIEESDSSIITLGHYNSEVGGVLMLKEKLSKEFNIDGKFINLATGF